MELTDGKGVDYVVECVGTPSGWDVCQDIVAVGGEISILGSTSILGIFSILGST